MKRHRVAEWIKKYKTQQYAAWRDSFSFRDIHTHIHIHIDIVIIKWNIKKPH